MAQKRQTIVTPKGTAIYPYLGKPDTKYNAKGEFRARIAEGVAQGILAYKKAK